MSAWREQQARDYRKRFICSWEKTRRLGFIWFVMVWGGGLGFGMGVLIACMYLVGFLLVPGHERSWSEVGRLPLWVFGLCVSQGLLASTVKWFWAEQKYRRCLRDVGREPTPPGTSDPDAG